MYILIMIVTMGLHGVSTSQMYYDNEQSCIQAAKQFESHGTLLKESYKAFCIQGD